MPQHGSVPYLDDIRSKDAANTFSRLTDSLEAISEAVAAIAGPGAISQGLVFYGKITTFTDSNNFKVSGLVGYGDDFFNGYVIYVLRDAGGASAAPQYESQICANYASVDGSFNHATIFSADLAVDDEILLINPALLNQVVACGFLTASSATVPADNLRTEGNDFFNGCLFMPVLGACFHQPRRIVDFTTGVFTLDPNNPLSAAPGLVPYIVLASQTEFAPTADGTNVRTPADTIGNKADTALYAAAATASLMRYIKALLATKVIATGTFTTSSATVPADTGRTEGNDYFKGCCIMPLAGVCAFQPRPIRQFTSGTDIFTLDEPYTAAPGLVAYAILAAEYPVQRLIDIFDAVNAILTLTETGGTLTATGPGTEDTLYINNAPAGEYEPKELFIDLDLMQGGDTAVIRIYYRLRVAGGLQLYDYQSYTGADGGLTDGRKLISVGLLPNRYGIQVTLEQTAGVMRNYDWDVHYAL